MRATADSTAPAGRTAPLRLRRGLSLLVSVATALSACGGPADGAAGPEAFEVGQGAPLVDGYHRAFEAGGGEAGIGRPTTAVERWSFGCRQRFAGGRSGTAVLLQQPCGRNEQVFALSGDFWDLYRRAGERAPTVYGFPLGPAGEWMGGRTQGFGRGGGFEAFFLQRPGGAPHVLTPPILERYLSFDDRHTRFGYPTSGQRTGADGRRCQQFEHALVTATSDDPRAPFEMESTSSSMPSSACH